MGCTEANDGGIPIEVWRDTGKRMERIVQDDEKAKKGSISVVDGRER
jgi:hypothetical protein